MQNVSIFFGKVVDVQDTELRTNRVRCSIGGYTDQIQKDDLPWYYPFFGVDYLPILGDTVPVLIFNMNFSTGMYNKKVDVSKVAYEGTEYENYLEVYKRLGVEITYAESVGIQLTNDKSRLQIEKGRAGMHVESNQILMVKDRIDLGTGGEATPLGDKTVKALQDRIDHVEKLTNSTMSLFNKIKSAATSPMLAPIRIALTVAVPLESAKFPPIVKRDAEYLKTIQSKKTFIE